MLSDISKSLPGGPTACEARELNGIITRIRLLAKVELVMVTRAFVSSIPKGFTPLKNRLARPSQKLRRLNTAPMAEGVFLGGTRRTVTPPSLNPFGSCVRRVPLSTRVPLRLLKVPPRTPCELATSLFPKGGAVVSTAKGKCAAVKVPFAPGPVKFVSALAVS